MDIFTDKASGVQFCMKMGNSSAEKIVEEGIPDFNLIKWCEQFISENGVFVDIGANIGEYSVLLGKKCKSVYSFEPQKENFDCLTISACVNSLYNTTIENVALGDHESTATLYHYSIMNDEKEDTECSLFLIPGKEPVKEETVLIKTLDSYDIKNVDFLKISVKGSELAVLKGASLTLVDNNFPPFILKVCLEDWFADEKELLLSFIDNLGYKVHHISGFKNMYLVSDHPLRIKKAKPVIETPPKYDIKELCSKYEEGQFDEDVSLEWDGWHELARHYRFISRHQTSYDCAHKGLKVAPVDKEYLFHEEISIVAFYINKRKEGFEAAEKVILSHYTPWSTKNLTLSNEGFYMSPIPVKRKLPLKYPMPLHYTPSSASIIKNGDGFLINLRGINYYLSEGGYGVSRHGDGIIRTINYLLDLDKDLNITKGVEVIDNSGVKLYPKNILGMEDIRLFGPNYFFCTYLELNESRTPQIGWGTYDSDTGSVTRMVPLMAGTQLKCEKNWLPFIDDDGEIYIIYAMGPFQLYHLDKEEGTVTEVKRLTLGKELVDTSVNATSDPRYINDFRGSASPISYKSGWLCTIHQVHHAEPRKYFHRFVWLNKEFTEIKFSLPFYFDKVGVEFNLSICESEDGMLMSYSHGDASSTIAIIDYKVIDDMLGF